MLHIWYKVFYFFSGADLSKNLILKKKNSKEEFPFQRNLLDILKIIFKKHSKNLAFLFAYYFSYYFSRNEGEFKAQYNNHNNQINSFTYCIDEKATEISSTLVLKKKIKISPLNGALQKQLPLTHVQLCKIWFVLDRKIAYCKSWSQDTIKVIRNYMEVSSSY